MTKRTSLGAGLAAGLLMFAALAGACGSSEPLRAPKSDALFDDPDQPPGAGTIGAVGAGSGKDASSDAARSCNIDHDCPTGQRCFFPLSGGCGARGVCSDYQDFPGCALESQCTCTGIRIATCAPSGFATAPVSPTCLDASADSATE